MDINPAKIPLYRQRWPLFLAGGIVAVCACCFFFVAAGSLLPGAPTTTPSRLPETRTFTPEFTATFLDLETNTSTLTPTAGLLLTATTTLTPALTDTPSPEYTPILGKIWTGVKVYYGLDTEKAYGFEILGGSDNCPSIQGGKGVYVSFPDGTEGWKDREYLVTSGLFFVLKADPALSKHEWTDYPSCP